MVFFWGVRMLRRLATVTVWFVSLATAAGAEISGFHLDRLPKGKQVTMPRPATTIVPITGRVTLTATDMPQSVSFKAVNVGNGPLSSIRISIFDPQSERVQYVDVQPGTPFLYSFREIGSITVVPQPRPGADRRLSLQVESNKPLEIAH